MSSFRSVIIDLDGTLIDTSGDFHAAIVPMLTELNLAPLDIETILRLVGKGTENLVRGVLSLYWSEEQVNNHFDQALATYKHYYKVMNGRNAEVYPGVMEGLESMKSQNLLLSCVTNKPIAFAEPLLESKGLRQYFDFVFGGDSFTKSKPNPEPILGACAAMQTSPAETLVIGDSSNDALSARAAGCTIWVLPYGYNHGQDVQSIDADGIVQTLHEAAIRLAHGVKPHSNK